MRIHFKILTIVAFSIATSCFAQVGMGTTTPAASSKLEVSSTTKGVLFPRMTNAQMLLVSNPVQGLQIYNTNANCMYYYDGQQWLSTLNAISVLADAGDVVQLDNFRVRVSTSGNRSMQISTLSGSIKVSGTSFNLFVSTNVGSTGGIGDESGISFASTTVGTTWMYLQSAANFTQYGNVQRLLINDETNNKCYRVTCIFGNGYLNNTLEIERIF
jgi:hypothetical protein